MIRRILYPVCLSAVAAASIACASPARADEEPATPTCASDPEYALLDFWLGDWDVFVKGKKVGENHIEKILAGCAITEDWTDAGGGRGRSLFYYMPSEAIWKQVWVTDQALGRGGTKEKTLVERLPDGGLRFQGEVTLRDGLTYLDRTTLTPMGPDEVRQLIEISQDGGKEWLTTFDGQYLRRK